MLSFPSLQSKPCVFEPTGHQTVQESGSFIFNLTLQDEEEYFSKPVAATLTPAIYTPKKKYAITVSKWYLKWVKPIGRSISQLPLDQRQAVDTVLSHLLKDSLVSAERGKVVCVCLCVFVYVCVCRGGGGVQENGVILRVCL